MRLSIALRVVRSNVLRLDTDVVYISQEHTIYLSEEKDKLQFCDRSNVNVQLLLRLRSAAILAQIFSILRAANAVLLKEEET